jgi:hypothetical protein
VKKAKKLWIGLGAGLGLAFTIPLLILLFIPGIFVKGMVIKRLEESLGGKAKVEAISFGWRRGLRLTNLFIKDVKGEKPILKVENLSLKFAILPFIKGRLVVHQLEVVRPEMVVHRGGEGPSLDGAPGLGKEGPSSENRKKNIRELFKLPSNLPEVKEARISGGTFVFVNARKGELARVENLDAYLRNMIPGATAQLNGTCDIISGGKTDHAEVSGTVQGFEEGRVSALKGQLLFKAGFAHLEASADMSKLDKPGAEVLRASLRGDSQQTITRLAPILALPKEFEMRGTVESEIDAVAQPGRLMLLEGQTVVTGLYLKTRPFSQSPFQSTKAVLVHRLGISPKEGTVRIERLDLDSDVLGLTSSGMIERDRTVKARLNLHAPVAEVLKKLACLGRPFGRVTASGDLRSEAEIRGQVGKALFLEGTSHIKNLEMQALYPIGAGQEESIKYSDPEVKLLYYLNYDQGQRLLYVKELGVFSRLLTLGLKEGIAAEKERHDLQANLSLLCHVEELPKWLALPANLRLKGDGRLNLELKGPFTMPLQRHLSAKGDLGLDRIIYDNYDVTKVTSEVLELKEGVLNSKLNFRVNEVPAKASVEIDLKPAQPKLLNGEFHVSKVPVTEELTLLEYLIPVIARGNFRGLVTIDIIEAKGEGLQWKKTLRKTLTAQGNLKVEDGSIYAGEVVSSVLNALGHPGKEYPFSSITSNFRMEGEKVYVKELHVKGEPFDLELSGWTGFDRTLDCQATAVLPEERVGKDLRQILGLVVRDKAITIPIRIKGDLSNPQVSLRLESVLEGLFKSLFK